MYILNEIFNLLLHKFIKQRKSKPYFLQRKISFFFIISFKILNFFSPKNCTGEEIVKIRYMLYSCGNFFYPSALNTNFCDFLSPQNT